MNETFEQLLSRLSNDQALLRGVEVETKQGAVLPILSHLGWNCFDVGEVSPEFTLGERKVDYCLRINQKKHIFLEVKRPTEDLERHEKQLLEYAFTEGIDIAVLTNGLTWWLYLPLSGGNWQQRKFFTIDITQQSPEIAGKHFREFIGRSAIENGSSLRLAKSYKENKEKNKLINETIPLAWKRLIEGPDEQLIEIFADKVESICGYKPEKEKLNAYIQHFFPHQTAVGSQANTTAAQSRENIKRKSIPKAPVPSNSKRKGAIITIDHHKTIKATSVTDLYRQTLRYLIESSLIERLKPYIPYATSSARLLISNDPHHQAGNEFRIPIEYKGYYMEAHKDYKNALSHLEAFLKSAGIEMKY